MKPITYEPLEYRIPNRAGIEASSFLMTRVTKISKTRRWCIRDNVEDCGVKDCGEEDGERQIIKAGSGSTTGRLPD